jgi:hypothetical protein
VLHHSDLPLAQKKRKKTTKKEKKVSQESFFQRKQRARMTTSVFACLANESTALLQLGQQEAGENLQNRPFDSRKKKVSLPTGSAACFC